MLTAERAKQKLIQGNKNYLCSGVSCSNVSGLLRKKTAKNGQEPYAVIITCSDARVMPESIFSTNLGDLFVIRVAGNVLGVYELGSIDYAIEHLGTQLVIVLGHTGCGAVSAAIAGETDGMLGFITQNIRHIIGDEADPYKAGCINVAHCVELIRNYCLTKGKYDDENIKVLGALYDIETGEVSFL